LAETRTADNPAPESADVSESRAAARHLAAGAFFLVLGGGLQLMSLMSLRFADLFPITYGRLEPMANLTLMIGFVSISLIGGVYYVLPRLTGTRLWGSELAAFGLYGTSGMVFIGLLAIFFGFGSGRQPLGIPWWLHIPMVFLLAIPAMITIGTISNRTENRSYVTLWFALGGVIWLPLLYLAYFAGDLPGLTATAIAYSDVFFSAGFVTMFLFTVGTGLFYYTLVKELDVPLASRQLAVVGFWSLGFAAVWWGTAQLMFGPGPSWLSGVGAALGLAFPIGALANAVNASLTLDGSWSDVRQRPAVRAGVIGLYLGVGVAVLAAFAGFRSISSVVSLTGFWEAIEYAALAGVGTLLIAGMSFGAVPRLYGRELYVKRVRSFITLTLTGSVGVLVFMTASGLLSGYSWVAGSNSAAYIDAGEGWGAGVGASVETLMLIAVGFAVVTFLGQLAYTATVFGTITQGRATTQEILVAKDLDDE
jgi:cbb3-type cytochrome oxidase subunit 1